MKKLPSIPEAEQALLGAVLYDNSVIDKFIEFLKPEHFFIPVHQKIYDVLIKVITKGQIADLIIIKNYLSTSDELDGSGGEDYLRSLLSMFASLHQVKNYADQIYDAFLRREIIKISDQSIQGAMDYNVDANAAFQIEKIEQSLFKLTQTDQSSRVKTFQSQIINTIKNAETAFKRDDHLVGVTTGLIDLDKALGGLHKSDLIILAGRPSMGKTALATNIAFNAAKSLKSSKKSVMFFSLEMSSEQLTLRILSQVARIPSDQIRRGVVTEKDFISFVDTSKKLYDIPLLIDDSAMLSIAGLRSKIRRAIRKNQVALVVIDYIQLMSNDAWRDNRVQQLSEISRGLKSIAKEFNIPILALSQLSRAVEQREDKHPQLADLRESGSIEQDADSVMFIYREEYYESRRQPSEDSDKFHIWQEKMQKVHGLAELIIAKQRHGPINNIKVRYESKFTKFDNFYHE